MELDIKSNASSADSIPGANPPSSPTAVDKPFLFNVFLRQLNTSTPQMRLLKFQVALRIKELIIQDGSGPTTQE